MIPEEKEEKGLKIKPNILQKTVIILLSFLYFTGIVQPCFEIILCSFPSDIADWMFACCSYIFVTITVFLCIFAVGRTYYYSQKGCTISFLFYRKMYKWEDLQIKKYEKNFTFRAGRSSCGEADGTFFSVRPYRYKRNGSPITRLEIFQPSKFYVLFPHEMKKNEIIPYPTADRNAFLDLLKEWGIEIEGLE